MTIVNKDPFKEYKRESDSDKRDKAYAWHTAIGLQAVDGLKTSEYLVRTAIRNIEGEISSEEASALIDNYYAEKAIFGDAKANFEAEKANIEKMFNPKTAAHVLQLLETFRFEKVFGRSDVQRELGLKPTRSSELLHEMAENGITVPVSGFGKGKYRFRSVLQAAEKV